MVDNGHPNARGHRLIAEALLGEIQRLPSFQRFLDNPP